MAIYDRYLRYKVPAMIAACVIVYSISRWSPLVDKGLESLAEAVYSEEDACLLNSDNGSSSSSLDEVVQGAEVSDGRR